MYSIYRLLKNPAQITVRERGRHALFCFRAPTSKLRHSCELKRTCQTLLLVDKLHETFSPNVGKITVNTTVFLDISIHSRYLWLMFKIVQNCAAF